MKELSCALVLAFVCVVTSTPYGYGVKTGAGAVAKADAGAIAGAFGAGGIPLGAGSGYSGSFSKSSASSFASSSASSSSSSFSFSGSGAAASGGCPSGNCHNAPGNGYSGGSNGLHAQNGANAAAGSGAFSSGGHTPCASPDCSGKPTGCEGSSCSLPVSDNKCPGGQCLPSNGEVPALDNNASKNDCSSGSCGPNGANSETSENKYDSNDIHVNIAGGASKSQSGYQHNSKDKLSSNDGNLKPGCSRGDSCDTDNNQLPFVPLQTSSYNGDVPSKHLTAPKEGVPCSSGNCNSPNYSNLPSSYNVPIYNTDAPNDKKQPGCATGNCSDKPLSNAYPTNSYSPSTSHSSDYVKPQSGCTTPNCAPSRNDKPSNSYVPSYNIPDQTGAISISGSNVPGYQYAEAPTKGGCGSSNCGSLPAKYPSYNQSPSYTPTLVAGTPGSNYPHGSLIPKPSANTPYTGGFGGPAGIIGSHNTVNSKPNENSPAYTGGFGGSSGNIGGHSPVHPKPNENKPYTGGFGGPSGSLGNHNPAPSKPSKDLPAYTGGFGGPAGVLKPNEVNVPALSGYKPVHTAPLANTQGSCASGNCDSSKQHYGINAISGANAQAVSGGSGGYNPVSCTTGNCGSSPGQYTPQYNQGGHNDGAESVGSPIPSKPTGNYGCTSGNCGPSSSQSAPQYNQGSHDTSNIASKPIASYGCALGNCGSSSAQLVPQAPHAGDNIVPNTSGFNDASKPVASYGCSSGNCGSQPNSYPSHYDQSGAAGTPTITEAVSEPYPTSCSSGICGASKDQQSSQYGHNVAGAHATTANVDSKPAGSYGCTSGNCGSQQVPSAPSQYGQSGTPGTSISGAIPEVKPSGSHPSAQLGHSASDNLHGNSAVTTPGNGCSSGKCGQAPIGHENTKVGSTASATASANAIAYTGGFGGPPGYLKPYDGGKAGNGANLGASIKPYGNQDNAGHDGSHYGNALSGSQAAAGASAVAGASAGAYNSANYHHNDDNGKVRAQEGCNGSCTEGNSGPHGLGFGGSASFGLSKTGLLDGLSGALGATSAAAKSVAGAIGGAGAGAFSGSYAHASSGAAVKTGYGRR